MNCILNNTENVLYNATDSHESEKTYQENLLLYIKIYMIMPLNL